MIGVLVSPWKINIVDIFDTFGSQKAARVTKSDLPFGRNEKPPMKAFTLWLELARAGLHRLVAVWRPKKRSLCPYSLFWGPEWSSGVTFENSDFHDFWNFWRPEGTPSDARLRSGRLLAGWQQTADQARAWAKRTLAKASLR